MKRASRTDGRPEAESKQSWQGIGEGRGKEIYPRLSGEGVRTEFLVMGAEADSKI